MSRYSVHYGLGEGSKSFATFVDALTFYIDCLPLRGGARVFNLDLCDSDPERETDGLTDEEKEAIEAADEMFAVEVAS